MESFGFARPKRIGCFLSSPREEESRSRLLELERVRTELDTARTEFAHEKTLFEEEAERKLQVALSNVPVSPAAPPLSEEELLARARADVAAEVAAELEKTKQHETTRLEKEFADRIRELEAEKDRILSAVAEEFEASAREGLRREFYDELREEVRTSSR